MPGPTSFEGPLVGPSFTAGGPASGPSATADELPADLIANPKGIVGVPSSDSPLLEPMVSSSLSKVTVSSKVKPTLAFSKALVSACGANQTETLLQKSSSPKTNTKSSSTGAKSKVPIVYNKSQQASNAEEKKLNSMGRGSVWGPSKKNR